jgi:DNA repair protein RecO
MLAFVLKRSDWREYDQIISLYTLESGRIEVLARGVKKILSKNSSFLEPGNLVEAEVILGKELNHLGSVQLVGSFTHLRSSGLMPVLIFSLDVFLNLITHQEKDERVFKLLYSWINFLDRNVSVSLVFSLDVFLVKLLKILGFDIVHEGKVGKEIQKDLELVSGGDWEVIKRLKFEGKEADVLHNTIYQFALCQAQKKLKDWAKLAYFSEK